MSLKMGGRWELGIRSEELGMWVGGGFVARVSGVGERASCPLFDGCGWWEVKDFKVGRDFRGVGSGVALWVIRGQDALAPTGLWGAKIGGGGGGWCANLHFCGGFFWWGGWGF